MDREQPAIIPVYRCETPNQHILLYQGPLSLEQNGNSHFGPGEVCWEWLPFPYVKFKIEPAESASPCQFGSGRLSCAESAEPAAALVSGVPSDRDPTDRPKRLAGFLQQALRVGCAQGIATVVFHVANLHSFSGEWISRSSPGFQHEWAGRTVLQADGWTITIDELENLRELDRNTAAVRGYTISHVGKIERCGASLFDAQAASDFLVALTHFLSFAHGFWCPCILPVGLDARGERVWQEWAPLVVDPWRDHGTWFSGLGASALSQAFSGFIAWWTHPCWIGAAETAVRWCIAARSPDSELDAAIVIQHAALDLLAWVRLVDETKSLTPKAFNEAKNGAQTNLRLLLEHCDIPRDVPRYFRELRAKASNGDRPDGPSLFVSIRNAIVHPRHRQWADSSMADAKVEVWKLGQWYLDLVLLRFCNYNGRYLNGAKARTLADTELVPWASGSDT